MYNKTFIKGIVNNRPYNFQEISDILQVHVRTVQSWHKSGLPVVDKQSKPFLVLGRDLIQYLYVRSLRRKRKLNLLEFLCMKCRQPRKAIPGSVKEEVTNLNMGNGKVQSRIIGKCEICGTKMVRFSTFKSGRCTVTGSTESRSCFEDNQLKTDKCSDSIVKSIQIKSEV